jgi:S-adenosylmethionine hydrolase
LLLTLTTDFGSRDWFVGVLKGVIARIAPRTRVVDLTHDIPPGDIRAGAFALATAYRFFPRGSIHLAIVDPGVGSSRRALAVQTADYCFVGPDNGLLSAALAREKIKGIRALENEKYFLHPVSHTFHGRDVFAPVAAHLSRGLPIRSLGPARKEFARLDWPEPRYHRDRTEGEVLYLDRFGNGITNLPSNHVPSAHRTCEIRGERKWVCPLRPFYQSVPPGQPVIVPGSSGFLEIAVNGGSAENQLGLKIGSRITLRPSSLALRPSK